MSTHKIKYCTNSKQVIKINQLGVSTDQIYVIQDLQLIVFDWTTNLIMALITYLEGGREVGGARNGREGEGWRGRQVLDENMQN